MKARRNARGRFTRAARRPRAGRAARKQTVVVTHIRLNRGGYDHAGRYFGVGPKLYMVDDEVAEQFMYVRAPTAKEARAKALAEKYGWKHYGRAMTDVTRQRLGVGPWAGGARKGARR